MQKKLEIKNLPDLEKRLGIPVSKLKNIVSRIEKLYTQKERDKDDGGIRVISAPKFELKNIQTIIHKKIFSKIDFGKYSHYGIKKRSNISNALKHKGSKVIFALDLKSFFPSIRPERVRQALIDEQACSLSVASLLTKLTTYNFELPQGAPTSTDIANIVTLRLQRRISRLATQWGKKEFTIYCDDIIISSDSIQGGFVDRMKDIIKDEGFKIHPSKGGVIDKSGAQIVTGVSISHGNSVGCKKKVWRAERHANLMKFNAGKLSKDEFEASENKYLKRMDYEKNVRNSK